jgi:hypothetical protein
MNKIEDIKSICKRPHIVQKGGMSITEIALALGITYQQAKTSLETGLYKIGILINDLKEEDSIRDNIYMNLVRPSFGNYKKTISNGDY